MKQARLHAYTLNVCVCVFFFFFELFSVLAPKVLNCSRLICRLCGEALERIIRWRMSRWIRRLSTWKTCSQQDLGREEEDDDDETKENTKCNEIQMKKNSFLTQTPFLSVCSYCFPQYCIRMLKLTFTDEGHFYIFRK